jgi:2-oxo-4-hydroxy-4-carboxy-5-ureidoimidazoline decarboxylase
VDGIAVFNSLPAERARAELLTCCAVPAWADAVAGGRPYPRKDALLAAAQAAARALTWSDVQMGLSAHPRIGERADGPGREAAWSRQEQSAASGGDPDGRVELLEANRRYEATFGHVFLIFASGRSRAEILAAARERLGNDVATERTVVADELRKIAVLRLERLIDGLG